MFGTDFPFGPSGNVAKGLIDYGFGAGDLRRIERDNMLGLMPQLGG